MRRKFIVIIILLFTFSLSQAQNGKKGKSPNEFESGKYTYTIGNGTDREINFFISTDSSNWEQITVVNSFQKKLYFDNERIFFKIHTSHNKYIVYKLKGNVTYKIYFNPDNNSFDLLKFDGAAYLDE